MPLHNIFGAMDASASALTGEKKRMGIAAENLANAGSTKRLPENGGLPYARQRVHFQTVLDNFGRETGAVEATVEKSPRYESFFDPDHPDADEDGMVTESDISPVLELTDLMMASKAYEANTNAIRGLLRMHETALRLGDR